MIKVEEYTASEEGAQFVSNDLTGISTGHFFFIGQNFDGDSINSNVLHANIISLESESITDQ